MAETNPQSACCGAAPKLIFACSAVRLENLTYVCERFHSECESAGDGTPASRRRIGDGK